jgi:FKBP-type peptidyl-prolyl cis-trans isomerase
MCMKKYIRITGAGLFALAMIFSSCVSTPDYTPPDYDAALNQYLEGLDKAKLTADKTVIDDSLHNKWHFTDIQIDPKGGVRYRILNPGLGEKPVLASSVLFSYRGILFDSVKVSNGAVQGTPFDSNMTPTSNNYAPVYNLIAGMQTTLPLLPEGTKVQMFIPSALGYGPDGFRNPNTGEYIIPKNAILFFELTIMDVYTQTQ